MHYQFKDDDNDDDTTTTTTIIITVTTTTTTTTTTTNNNNNNNNNIFFSVALRPIAGHDLPILEVFQITQDTPQSVRFLWTSDQPVAETST